MSAPFFRALYPGKSRISPSRLKNAIWRLPAEARLRAKGASNEGPSPIKSSVLADIDLGVEADRLAVAPRHRDDVRIVIAHGLEQGFGGAPEIIERRVVMRRYVDIR